TAPMTSRSPIVRCNCQKRSGPCQKKCGFATSTPGWSALVPAVTSWPNAHPLLPASPARPPSAGFSPVDELSSLDLQPVSFQNCHHLTGGSDGGRAARISSTSVAELIRVANSSIQRRKSARCILSSFFESLFSQVRLPQSFASSLWWSSTYFAYPST